MIGCQILIFTAMLEYGYVLFLVKFRTRMVEDRTEISNPKLHEKIRKLDGASFRFYGFDAFVFSIDL